MSGPESPTVWEALVLGVLHGPAELMPISSSAHVTAVPYLLGWDYATADPERRKSFEVALHAGAALALLLGLRDRAGATVGEMTPARLAQLVVASVPAALAGSTLQKPIERRLGTPATIPVGMIAGALALAWGDRAPRERHRSEAGMRDALWLGIAQASALIPGISRHGATLTAARRRHFTRRDANMLSRQLALPVIAGASGLRTLRLLRGGVPAGTATPLLLGALASFGSTLLSMRLVRAAERDVPLTPYAVYRLLLALAVLRRERRGEPRRAGGSALRGSG